MKPSFSKENLFLFISTLLRNDALHNNKHIANFCFLIGYAICKDKNTEYLPVQDFDKIFQNLSRDLHSQSSDQTESILSIANKLYNDALKPTIIMDPVQAQYTVDPKTSSTSFSDNDLTSSLSSPASYSNTESSSTDSIPGSNVNQEAFNFQPLSEYPHFNPTAEEFNQAINYLQTKPDGTKFAKKESQGRFSFIKSNGKVIAMSNASCFTTQGGSYGLFKIGLTEDGLHVGIKIEPRALRKPDEPAFIAGIRLGLTYSQVQRNDKGMHFRTIEEIKRKEPKHTVNTKLYTFMKLGDRDLHFISQSNYTGEKILSDFELDYLQLKIAHAVYLANKLGVIHGDLKPENIVISKKGNDVDLFLIDVGLAHILNPGQTEIVRPSATGTYPYIAPEIVTRQLYSSASEVYALGWIFLFDLHLQPYNQPALKGKIPYQVARQYVSDKENNPESDILAIMQGEKDIDLSIPNLDLIQRMLAYNKDERISLEALILTLCDRFVIKYDINTNLHRYNEMLTIRKSITQDLNYKLLRACSNNQVNWLATLLKHPVEVTAEDANGMSPLYIASANGFVNIVCLLLNQHGININQVVRNGTSSLQIACEKGRIEVVKELLARPSIDINYTNQRGNALHYAAKFNQFPVVSELLKHHISVNVQDSEGLTPLLIAMWLGHFDIAMALLYDSRVDSTIMINGKTAIDFALSAPLDYAMKKFLLNKTSEAMLLRACYSNNRECVVSIIKHDLNVNTNVNIRDAEGWTPLHIVAKNGYVPILSLLLYHPRIDLALSTNGLTAFHLACLHGQRNIVKALLAYSNRLIMQTSPSLGNALHYACKQNQVEVLQELLDHPIDVNAKDEKGLTPLLLAIQLGHSAFIKILVQDPRVDLNLPLPNGMTPLVYAFYQRNIEIICVLLMSNTICTNTVKFSMEEKLMQMIDDPASFVMSENIRNHLFDVAIKYGFNRLYRKVLPQVNENQMIPFTTVYTHQQKRDLSTLSNDLFTQAKKKRTSLHN